MGLIGVYSQGEWNRIFSPHRVNDLGKRAVDTSFRFVIVIAVTGLSFAYPLTRSFIHSMVSHLSPQKMPTLSQALSSELEHGEAEINQL